MNTGPQGPQGSQPNQTVPVGSQQQTGQQQQQPQRKLNLFKPEQMRLLPEPFTDEEKHKWEAGLRTYWTKCDSNGPETQVHQEAKKKLIDFSRTLHAKIQKAAQTNGTRPPIQGQPQPGGEGGNQNGQKARPPSKISPKLMEHVNNFPFQLPSNVQPGSEEAQKWLIAAKSAYLKALMAMEQASARLVVLDTNLRKLKDEGKILTAEEEKDYNEKKEQAQKQHVDAKTYVDHFRQQQKLAAQQAQQTQQGQSTQQGSGNAAQQAPRPGLNPQQPNTVTQSVNAAIEAARNQQMGGGRPNVTQNGQVSQGQAISAQSTPQIGGQNMNIKVESNVPTPINTSIIQMQQGQRPIQNSPQSAVPRSANLSQVANIQHAPQALSHSDATALAARAYSSCPQPSPNPMGHSHPTPAAIDHKTNQVSNKMPIAKHLPERATAPPQPVPMSQGRPSYTGGASNVGNGVLGQPVLAKTPGFNMEGEGDRVLSKKKLDELVRQVTGGGQGSGEGLMPDVEESVLQVADNFVDQVLQAACKNAKERGSKVLEIRDIQLTLERGYNIRIPGYASDEIRTVRKIQPAPGWISKMSAVQAAKVTGSKNND